MTVPFPLALPGIEMTNAVFSVEGLKKPQNITILKVVFFPPLLPFIFPKLLPVSLAPKQVLHAAYEALSDFYVYYSI